MEVTPKVKLLDHAPDPVRTIYVAFRTCYSSLSPQQIWRRIEDGRITRAEMLDFIARWLRTGHTSPRTHVWYTFGVSGVSRSLSHQLVRHHVGITFDQQSQRYYAFKNGDFPYVVPDTIRDRPELQAEYTGLMQQIGQLYDRMLKAGVPAEDARFMLPNSAATNIVFTANYESLLHIADQRLCTRAQWEIRRFWAKVRAEVKRATPELAQFIQPKCGEHRLGYCDEDRAAWAACPLGRVRPHKDDVLQYARVPARPDEGDGSPVTGDGGLGATHAGTQTTPPTNGTAELPANGALRLPCEAGSPVATVPQTNPTVAPLTFYPRPLGEEEYRAIES